MKHRVTVNFDGQINFRDRSEMADTLQKWFETRDYFRIVLHFELVSTSIVEIHYEERHFAFVTGEVVWDIEGLHQENLMDTIFMTLCSQVCGPTIDVSVKAWHDPEMEVLECTP